MVDVIVVIIVMEIRGKDAFFGLRFNIYIHILDGVRLSFDLTDLCPINNCARKLVRKREPNHYIRTRTIWVTHTPSMAHLSIHLYGFSVA